MTYMTVAITYTAFQQGVASSQMALESSQGFTYTVLTQWSGTNTTLVSQSTSGESPLVAWVHQFGASMNDPLAAKVHQNEDSDSDGSIS